MAKADDLAKGVVEQLSEDETLRGDLTDDGFSPLLDWAVAAATAYAQTQTQNSKAQDAMQAYAARLKGVIQAVVAAADAGKIEDVNALLDFELPDAAHTQAALLKLDLSPDAADDNATKLAEVLSKALKAPVQAPKEQRVKDER